MKRQARRRPVPLEIGENLKSTPLLGAHFRCTQVIPGDVLAPDRVCSGRGRIWLRPAENGDKVPDAPFVGVSCHRTDR